MDEPLRVLAFGGFSGLLIVCVALMAYRIGNFAGSGIGYARGFNAGYAMGKREAEVPSQAVPVVGASDD